MTMLERNGHAEPATRAWDDRLATVERRLAEIVETGEQRIVILRDAIGDFCAAELAQRDGEIVILKKHIADLEQKLQQKTAVDQQVQEIATRLEERQARRDREKNGITDGDIIQTMDMVIAEERQAARKEFKAADDEMQRAFEVKLAALEERLRAVPGKLPVAKIWHAESVIYQAEFVCHDGSLYQARKDTAQVPGESDWVCVARAGRDGCDGLTLNFRGGLDAYEKYRRLDVVEFDGSSFVAVHDNPGSVPGADGWQLLCNRGTRGVAGDVGPRGRKGERGEAAPTIVNWTIDTTHYRAIPTMADGRAGTPLDLRPLFERFCEEAVGPAVAAAVTAALKDATRTNPGLFAPL